MLVWEFDNPPLIRLISNLSERSEILEKQAILRIAQRRAQRARASSTFAIRTSWTSAAAEIAPRATEIGGAATVSA